MAKNYYDRIRIHAIDDREALERLTRIANVLDIDSSKIACEYLTGVSIPLSKVEETEVIEQMSLNKATLTWKLDDGEVLNVRFYRGITNEAPDNRGIIKLNYQSSLRENEFILERVSSNGSIWEVQSSLIATVKRIIRDGAVEIDQAQSEAGDDLGKLMAGINRSHRAMIRDLHTEHERLRDYQKAVEKEQQQHAKEMREEHEAKLAEIEEEREQLHLDSYKSERRRLLKGQIDETTKQEYRANLFPPRAVSSRWAVFYAAIAGSFVAACFSFLSFDSITRTGEMIDWMLLVRGIFSSIVAIGFVFFAVTWMKSFYETEVEVAREMQRFNADLVRSSWIIETVLEVQSSPEGKIPDAWINGVTRGLFSGTQDEDSQVAKGQQAIAALLGYAGSVSVGPDGARVDVGKNGARRLSKDLQAESA